MTPPLRGRGGVEVGHRYHRQPVQAPVHVTERLARFRAVREQLRSADAMAVARDDEDLARDEPTVLAQSHRSGLHPRERLRGVVQLRGEWLELAAVAEHRW